MKLTIERSGVPTVKLNLQIISQNKPKLEGKKPVALILPGGPGADHRAYLKYSCLQAFCDIVFHDPRGCGQSEKGDLSACNMNNYIDDIESIRQQLGLEKIIVIGKSYGAMCALGYTLRYPHAVKKLVLAAGAPSYRFLERAKKNLKRIGTPEQNKASEKLWAGSFANNEELLYFFCVTNTLYSVKAATQPETFDLTQKCMQFSYEVLNEGFRNAFWQFDFENELRNVLCPTLLLSGRKDWINDVTLAEFMAARIPYSQLHIFDQASHAMEADVPETFFQIIADFIS